MIATGFVSTAEDVARFVGGVVSGSPGRIVSGVSTDSRDVQTGRLFVALEGARFDGHDFAAEVLERGAAALLVSERGWKKAVEALPHGPSPEPTFVLVPDTLRALGDLARVHRRRFRAPVIALTGSSGKTTTKEMIAAILSASRRVLKTEGNLNNLIGVPMTLLGFGTEHEVAVVEMGMNAAGEIARLTEIAEPDVGLIVNVGPAHIGMLGSLNAITLAKGELYRGLDPKNAVGVVNLDDPNVVEVGRELGSRRVRTFGRAVDADVRLIFVEPKDDQSQRIGVTVDGRALELTIPFAGEHNAMNAAAAIAASTAPVPEPAIPATLDDVLVGLPRATGVVRRLQFEPVGPYLVVDDCYNANASSMVAAIETVSSRVDRRGGRFVALLGEMRELGAFSEAEHQKVGKALSLHHVPVVAAFGPSAKPIAEVAASPGVATHHETENVDAMAAWLFPRLCAGDVILVKGSRGIRMERFIELLRAVVG